MTERRFDDLFLKCKDAFRPKSEQELLDKFNELKDENGQINLLHLMAHFHLESIEYTNDLVYSILREALVEDN